VKGLVLVETSNGLTKESEVTESVAESLMSVSEKLKNITSLLKNEIAKFKI
jgi:hypothetical protein